MSTPSLLVVGLGNPGTEYEATRHNVGFQVVDALAEQLGVSFDRHPDALVGWGRDQGHEIGLALPLTYVNRSGDAVVALRNQYDVPLDRLVVVVDDLNLPVGTTRLRPGGSSGGHNGLAHIAQRLGTTDYPRLRIGIGNDFPNGGQVDYVLSPFTAEQKPQVRQAIEAACEALLTVARDDLETAMNRFN